MRRKELRGRGTWQAVPRQSISAVLVLVAVFALACGSSDIGTAGQVLDAQGVKAVAVADGDGHEGTEIAGHVDEHGDGKGAEPSRQDGHDGEAGDLLEVTINVVEGRTWRYEPATLEIPAGQRVRLTYVNDGRAEHDMEIPGLPASNVEREGGVAHDVSLGGGHRDDDVVAAHAMPGTTAVVLFTPTQPGEYDFNCTLPGHKEAGMVGRIIVVP